MKKLSKTEVTRRFRKHHIKPLEKYKGTRYKTWMKCSNGHKWKGQPQHVFEGHSCPKCASIKAHNREVCPKHMAKRLERVGVKIIGHYNNSETPIFLQCTTHPNHIWKQRPMDAIRNHGCPKCRRKNKRNHFLKITYKRFKKHGVTPLESYKDEQTKIWFKCEYNHKWRTRPACIFQDEGCPYCSGQRLTQSEAEKRFNKKGIDLLGQYIKNSMPVKARCQRCEYTWPVRPEDIFSGDGCPKCAIKQEALKKHLSPDEVRRRFVKAHIKVIGKYVDSQTPVRMLCIKCGHIWTTIPNNIFSGERCNVCQAKKLGIAQRLSKSEVIKRLARINLILSSKYKGTHHKIQVQCMNCRRKWCIMPSTAFNYEYNPCTKCYPMSRGERIFYNILIKYGLEESKYHDYHCKDGDFVYGCNNIPWLHGMHLDFVIPKILLAIEIQGRQHYESVKYFGGKKQLKNTKQHDIDKCFYCKLEGFTLIPINANYNNYKQLKAAIVHQFNKSILPWINTK